MNDCIGFKSRRDIIRLLAALVLPWLMLGISIAPALICNRLSRAGMNVEPLATSVTIWFYLVSLLVMFSPIVLFFFGVWKLICRSAYRRSLYGWIWLLLMYLNMCAVGPVGHSLA